MRLPVPVPAHPCTVYSRRHSGAGHGTHSGNPAGGYRGQPKGSGQTVEIQVICPECGKRVSLRGLNGHLRFEHDYSLQKARKIASGIDVDATLNRLEQEVMQHVTLLYQLKEEAEELKEARREGVIGETLYERMITQKGQELTAATRYLQRLENSWLERMGERIGVPDLDEELEIEVPPDTSESG